MFTAYVHEEKKTFSYKYKAGLRVALLSLLASNIITPINLANHKMEFFARAYFVWLLYFCDFSFGSFPLQLAA